MNTPFDHTNPPDFVSDYLDGVATPEQLSELAAWLRASPENVDRFAAFAFVDGLINSTLHHQEEINKNLRSHLAHQAGGDQKLLDLMNLLEPQQPIKLVDATQELMERELERQRACEAAEAAEAAKAEKYGPYGKPGRRVIVIPRSVVYFATAAMLAFAFWIGHLVFMTGKSEPNAIVLSPQQPEPVFVAEIVQTAGNFVGPASDNPRINHKLAMGTPVVFESGYAQVLFNNGANVYIQAPAIIEPTSADALRLSTGRLTAVVPTTSSGFSVQCGDARISAEPNDSSSQSSLGEGVELGIAAENQSVEVYAYAGQVRLDSSDASHSSKQLNAGEVVGINQEGLTEIEPENLTSLVRSEAFEFYAESSSRLQHLAAQDGDTYLQTVVDLRPAAWWRFDPGSPVLGNPLGLYEIAADPLRTGHHLELDGHGAIDAGDIFPFTGSESFSMACWVRPEQTNQQFLFGRMDHNPQGAYRGYDLFLYEDRVLFQAKNEYFSLDTGKNNLIRVQSNDPVIAGEWVHIVATYDGSRRASGTQLYINGVQQQPEVLDDSLTGSILTSVPFRIGVRGAVTPDKILSRHQTTGLPHYRHIGKAYHGGIDEVMVFDYELSDESASTLYRESMPKYQITFLR